MSLYFQDISMAQCALQDFLNEVKTNRAERLTRMKVFNNILSKLKEFYSFPETGMVLFTKFNSSTKQYEKTLVIIPPEPIVSEYSLDCCYHLKVSFIKFFS